MSICNATRLPQPFSRVCWMVLACAALVMSGWAQAQLAPPVLPSPALTPSEAVQAQLEGLKAPDSPSPGAGYAQVFAFASPGNRAQTGPLQRFTRMLQVGYPDMLNHRSASIESVAQDGRTALAEVRFVTSGGAVVYYIFVLRQQKRGDCVGCWMTDGVSERTADHPAEIVT